MYFAIFFVLCPFFIQAIVLKPFAALETFTQIAAILTPTKKKSFLKSEKSLWFIHLQWGNMGVEMPKEIFTLRRHVIIFVSRALTLYILNMF